MRIILASASPRRAEILTDAGVAFETISTEIDESRQPGESVAAMVSRLAEAKAFAAAARLSERELGPTACAEATIIIGADTSVEVDGEALGKPGSAAEAREMLSRLSGRTHRVLSGICILRLPDGSKRCEIEITNVKFAVLERQEIDAYVETGDPLDKAGGYGIQGAAGKFVERIEGCYFNVVGLPLASVYRTLKELGWTQLQN